MRYPLTLGARMPAVLLTAFCVPIQRPVASGPAKRCVSAPTDGELRPSATPVASSSAAPAVAPTAFSDKRHTPTPAALSDNAVLYARLGVAPRRMERSMSHPAAR